MSEGVGSGNWSKMEKWLVKLKKVLEKENIVFLTDDELMFLVNKELDKKDRITRQTFHNWKNGKFGSLDKEIGEEFLEVITLAIIKQKNFLLDKLLNTNDKNWTKIAWLLERKFEEWNLKHISENIHKNEQQVTINITAGTPEQKNLIDSIINIDHIDLTPDIKKIDNQNNVKDNDVEF